MAVVFISPKQRQNMFFLGITVMFVLFLLVVSFGVFVSKPKESSLVLVFNKPKVNIDMTVFDSEQFKNLQDFTEMQKQYSYVVSTKDNKQRAGFLYATSIEEAKKNLEAQGYIVVDLQEAKIGRINPFTPYYQVTTSTSKISTKTVKK